MPDNDLAPYSERPQTAGANKFVNGLWRYIEKLGSPNPAEKLTFLGRVTRLHDWVPVEQYWSFPNGSHHVAAIKQQRWADTRVRERGYFEGVRVRFRPV